MQPEVVHVLSRIWDKIDKIGLNTWQIRTLDAIRRCRTASLGGHVDACDECGNIQISYNSCRNRHCPKCQGEKRAAWIEAREAELLPTTYFHVVFTLPCELNKLALCKPKIVYDSLFSAAWNTVLAFSEDKKYLAAQPGMVAILHTWGQNLSLHPHLHCIIPGGGVNKNGIWKSSRTKGKFLFPVKAMSKVYRAKYTEELRKRMGKEAFNYGLLFRKDWVIYAKRPFGSPKSVIEYLGRYTHKIAISNQRIKSIDHQNVTFQYKDYKTGAQKKAMTLTHEEFIRRFAMHILPKSFVRIRHFGILSSTWKRHKLGDLQRLLWKTPPIKPPKKQKIQICPCCKTGKLLTILHFGTRGPPPEFQYLGGNLNSPTL